MRWFQFFLESESRFHICHKSQCLRRLKSLAGSSIRISSYSRIYAIIEDLYVINTRLTQLKFSLTFFNVKWLS